ncbi:PKD domain-containing protein [Halorussus sp. MSC15.2]|uniref:PKD domain-containing protein n=1 Tax=Halorussus sp. MSC15.2 TaxID=2283638 RepID=UPI0013D2A302|nr:PKD domain-containing protein [Halorussus sp. MSC15.2]NEU57792.1 PKD domain-containing protein [Halorussus sp. MSC15.2]
MTDADESVDAEGSCSRRTALKTVGAAGLGLAGSVVATGDVAAAGPTAVIEADALPPEEGENVTFDGSSSSGDVQSYTWYFRNNESVGGGYGEYASGPSFTESWANYPYSVKLEVTDADGNTDSAVVDFFARPVVTPIARIEEEPATGDPDIRTFIGRYSSAPRGSIESYTWYYRNDGIPEDDFGKYADGPTFTEQFASGYQYTVKLEVTDSRGRTASDTVTFQN